MKTSKKGFFIVIDGTDGAGKATQTKLLGQRLRREGRKAFLTGFPQYETPSGQSVKQYLSGKMGRDASKVGPYGASGVYAVDRFLNSPPIWEALGKGQVVVSDRYTAANMGHQGGKFSTLPRRRKFFTWLRDLEYEKFKLPRPDITIILRVPVDTSQGLITKRGQQKDIHENDLGHLRAAEKTFVQITKLYPKEMILVECMKNGKLLSRTQIHALIWKAVSPLLKKHYK